MAKYRVLEKSFINNTLHEEGTVIEFDGVPGTNLERVDEPTRKPGKARAEPAAGQADGLL